MNIVRARIERRMSAVGAIPCTRCAQAGRYGVKATQTVGNRLVCNGCAREMEPGICKRGCGQPVHKAGCKQVNALKRCS
jgi:hypothetical protein